MPLDKPVPAAQYLRMSTEHQQYSLENQAAAIQSYALAHDFAIVHTYTDAGRSGVVLKHREGLRQLLKDVLNGDAFYSAILVYDVSRWGRFQDADEAGHYEFLCRSAGIPVHYCAESFSNDETLANMLIKALKRMMAAEYSRELSVKVYQGAKHLTELGFRQGGIPGYGFRRMLISPSLERKQELLPGQRKSIKEDRVILVPGPTNEVYWVRRIFRMFTEDGKMPASIAQHLNRKRVKYLGITRKEWYPQAVNRLLKNPKYAGYAVYGRQSQKLHRKRVTLPRKAWIVTPEAWTPIVSNDCFQMAQRKFESQTCHKSNEQLIAELSSLLAKAGKLSERIVMGCSEIPSQGAYTHRFGSMSEAFALAGYSGARLKATETRRKRRVLRDQLIKQIIEHASDKVTVMKANGRCKPCFRLPDQSLVSIYISHSFKNKDGGIRWLINPGLQERKSVALVARLNANNDSFLDFHLVRLPNRTRITMELSDPLLSEGEQLGSLADFLQVTHQA